ncbi:hypothetical protein [Streptomyces dangxiongensis]|uniref:hypothetical protein n=1 Tax=Streptomyces dangxiongensis TaxID=1442032 RepID=UPI0030B81F47
MNTDALEFALPKAERRVLEMQTKLHCWATDDRDRRFDDLFDLAADPAFLLVAWDRVRRNRGARSAGVWLPRRRRWPVWSEGCGMTARICRRRRWPWIARDE